MIVRTEISQRISVAIRPKHVMKLIGCPSSMQVQFRSDVVIQGDFPCCSFSGLASHSCWINNTSGGLPREMKCIWVVVKVMSPESGSELPLDPSDIHIPHSAPFLFGAGYPRHRLSAHVQGSVLILFIATES